MKHKQARSLPFETSLQRCHMARTSHRTALKHRRKPLTKDMLLPLSAARVRALSLEYHLALAAIRGGHGSEEVVIKLVRVLYLTWFIHDGARGRPDAEVFREAEAALSRSAMHAQQHQQWMLPDPDHRVLGDILALHDQQLALLPSHRYTEAWERARRFVLGDTLSPIPD
ncbi:hypothetical protein P3T23_009726 [Paraburkholderia sp. GAS448]|uniref:hypothetical protein n=1 Tax=Paraburkholderia sp. GAS448 TaxID=3035136 RepID=UPI003D23930E